jgi:hypothetical protein
MLTDGVTGSGRWHHRENRMDPRDGQPPRTMLTGPRKAHCPPDLFEDRRAVINYRYEQYT